MHWAPSQETPLLSGGRRWTCHRGARVHKTQDNYLLREEGVAGANREGDSAEIREEAHTPVKMRKQWTEPSAEERVRHSKLQCPFMAWCEFCVMGKCHNDSHIKRNATPMQTQWYLLIMLI